MSTIGAFMWDSDDESIKYFILNNNKFTEPSAVIIKCSEKNQEETKKTIKLFLDQLSTRNKNGDNILIEYKTYFDSPQAYRHAPNKITVLVDNEFENALKFSDLKKKASKVKFLLKGKNNIKAFNHFLEKKIY